MTTLTCPCSNTFASPTVDGRLALLCPWCRARHFYDPESAPCWKPPRPEFYIDRFGRWCQARNSEALRTSWVEVKE